jgi:biopolymer transport protein ExbB
MTTSTDPTTIAASSARELPLGELLAQGGWAMIPIYVCSALALAVFVHKWLELRGVRADGSPWFDAALSDATSGDLGAAVRTCRKSTHPGARVVAALLNALGERPELAESEAKRVGNLELDKLERWLGLLSFLARVAPLLGLLGTVLGMVDLFMDLQGAGQAQLAVDQLASGIWKALLTTAAGLTVAVPALAAHAYLTGRVDAVRLVMADMAQRVLYHVPARVLAEDES